MNDSRHDIKPATDADVLKRISHILYRTPQVHYFSSSPADLATALDTVERVMTQDLGDAVRRISELEGQLREMRAERNTVRAFFGVVDGESPL